MVVCNSETCPLSLMRLTACVVHFHWFVCSFVYVVSVCVHVCVQKLNADSLSPSCLFIDMAAFADEVEYSEYTVALDPHTH